MSALDIILLFYFAAVSCSTAIFTLADKHFAKKGMWRISEKSLLIMAFFGGAPAEYFIMRLIRHKTQHKKFMLGLPFIIILQLIAVIVYLHLTRNH